MTVVDLSTLAHVQEEKEHKDALAEVNETLTLLETYALCAGIMTFLTMTFGGNTALIIADMAESFLADLKGSTDGSTDNGADDDADAADDAGEVIAGDVG